MSKTPDDITFALYYDDELNLEESKRFEDSLRSDPELFARYQFWVETQESLAAHFESLESNYELGGFTDRVMSELPEVAPWEVSAASPARAVTPSEPEGESWIKRLIFPLLIGSLTAAVILMIVDRRAPSGPGGAPAAGASQDNTTLIKDNEVKVTWLEDEEEEELEGSEGDGGI